MTPWEEMKASFARNPDIVRVDVLQFDDAFLSPGNPGLFQKAVRQLLQNYALRFAALEDSRRKTGVLKDERRKWRLLCLRTKRSNTLSAYQRKELLLTVEYFCDAAHCYYAFVKGVPAIEELRERIKVLAGRPWRFNREFVSYTF